jgi:tetratricopeptide (TPR) repeat protein
MGATKSIRSLVREAKLYREQGLLEQSRDTYYAALEQIDDVDDENRGPLEEALKKAIHTVEVELRDLERMDDIPDLSDDMKGLIRRLFSVSEDSDIAQYKGAVALAQFGQYGEALEEFNRLLQKGNMAVLAAKNIITCHLTFASPEVAVSQFERWVLNIQMTRKELSDIRLYLERILKRDGVDMDLSMLEDLVRKGKAWDPEGEEVLPICSVRLPYKKMIGEERGEELDVFLHAGSAVSIQVPPERKDLLRALRLGTRIIGMRFFTTMAYFEGNGLVISRKQIESGPREGYYTLDIHVEAA